MDKKELDKYVEELKAMNWEESYDKDFLRSEKLISFQDAVDKPIFSRMKWQFNVIREKGMSEINLLDVGCGNGVFLYHLIKDKSLPVQAATGLDVSPSAIKAATSNLSQFKDKISFKQGYGEKLPFKDKQFNVVTCSQVLEHVKDTKLLMKELTRVCNGLLLITVPIEKELDDAMHIHYFKYIDLMQMFDKLGYPYKISMINKWFTDSWANIFAIQVITNGK